MAAGKPMRKRRDMRCQSGLRRMLWTLGCEERSNHQMNRANSQPYKAARNTWRGRTPLPQAKGSPNGLG